ncbi:MAG TPA: hypothetical protein VGG31_05135 [Candidatus Dormibacteraeota bacterium]|jgi:hypothetical protein
MRCDICNEDFPNSEEIKLHKEREHPMGERKDEELESPDRVEGEESTDGEPVRPEPVIRPVR